MVINQTLRRSIPSAMAHIWWLLLRLRIAPNLSQTENMLSNIIMSFILQAVKTWYIDQCLTLFNLLSYIHSCVSSNLCNFSYFRNIECNGDEIILKSFEIFIKYMFLWSSSQMLFLHADERITASHTPKNFSGGSAPQTPRIPGHSSGTRNSVI